jgi:K+-sensing histidine kinase KdpD
MLINKRYVAVEFSESELRERNKALSILLDISNFLSRSQKLNDVLDGALLKVLEHFDLDAGRIYLMDEGGHSLTLSAHRGIETAGLEKVKINEGFTGKAAHNRTFVLQAVADLEDQQRSELLTRKGLKIIICVPLIAMNKVVGVLNLASTRHIELDQGKIDLFSVIGNQIAIAVENARLYGDLRSKIQELREKGETIKFFAYSALHDLKSPVIGVHGLTKLLHRHYREVLDEKGRSYCDQILKAAAQTEAFVERINAFIMAKETPLRVETLHVQEITELIRNEFSPILQQRHIRWSEPESLPDVRADRLSLIRVFRNLVDNALKYGGEELSEICIDYRESAEFHTFLVSDDGVGIKQEHADKLFKMFQRHETSKGIEGTGLGLAIIRVIAERHRGHVTMEPGAAHGVTFLVSIAKDL